MEALPASAAPQTVVKLVALGDSIAAGQGGGVPLDACARTAGGYRRPTDQIPKVNLLRNAACTGATIEDTWAQLSQVNRGTTAVTLTVGANDLGLDRDLAACSAAAAGADPTACFTAIQGVYMAAPGLVPELAALIGAIAERAPNATIVVTGYPHLFAAAPPIPQFDNLNILIAQANGATDALNGAIQAAVLTAAADGVDHATPTCSDIQRARRPARAGVPSAPWFGTDPMNDPAGYLHPTYAGYTAYASVIKDLLGL